MAKRPFSVTGIEPGGFAWVRHSPNTAGQTWHGDEMEVVENSAEATHLMIKVPMVHPQLPNMCHFCELPLQGRWKGDGPYWELSGTDDAPTLSPSIKRETYRDNQQLVMHGHYVSGKWVPCDDSNW